MAIRSYYILFSHYRLVIYQLVVCAVIDIASQLTIMLSNSHVKEARPCFWSASTVFRVTFAPYNFKV